MNLSRLCLAVLMAVPFVAHAGEPGVYANASLSGLSFQLIDLTPDDGIAPTVTFGPSSGYVSALGLLNESDYAMSQSAPIDLGPSGFTPVAPVSMTLTGASASATSAELATSAFLKPADVVNTLDPSDRRLQWLPVSGVTSDVAIGPNYDTSVQQNIILGANTGIVLTGMAHISGQYETTAIKAALDALPNNQQTWLGWGGSATARVVISLIQHADLTDEAGTAFGFDETRSDFSLDRSAHADQAFDHSSPFALKFFNVGGQTTEVALSVLLQSNVWMPGFVDFSEPTEVINPPITPGVPEPSTYMLMGLGLVGLALARSRVMH